MPTRNHPLLLPHERWFASYLVERRAGPSPSIARLLRVAGPEAVAFYASGLIDIASGMVIGCAGLLIYGAVISFDSSTPAIVGLLIGIGLALIVLGLIRTGQNRRAMERFRSAKE
jgi:hypothetical protein